jgi:hypothetical protein
MRQSEHYRTKAGKKERKMSSGVKIVPQNKLNPEKFEDFGQMLAYALSATVQQLNAGDLTVKAIFTQVHGKMRAEYILLRKDGKSHKEAVRKTNLEAVQPMQAMPYVGGW